MTTRSRKQLFTPAEASELRPVYTKSAEFPVPTPAHVPQYTDQPVPGDPGDVDGATLPVYVTTEQLATMFGRRPRTVRNWVARGLLKPHRMGRSVFFLLSDIDAIDR
jgi:hypothetical protein